MPGGGFAPGINPNQQQQYGSPMMMMMNATNSGGKNSGLPPSRVIYIGNLPDSYSISLLLDQVKAGIIESVRMLVEKHCAFLTFVDTESAISLHNQVNTGQRRIVVNGTEAKIGFGKSQTLHSNILEAVQNGATRNVYIGNIDIAPAGDDFSRLDSGTGERAKTIGNLIGGGDESKDKSNGNNSCHDQLAGGGVDEDDDMLLFTSTSNNGHSTSVPTISAPPTAVGLTTPPGTSTIMKNHDTGTNGITEGILREVLGKYGTIEHVRLVRDKRCAFVHFLDISSATRCVRELPTEPGWGLPRKINYGRDRCAPSSATPNSHHQQPNVAATAMAGNMNGVYGPMGMQMMPGMPPSMMMGIDPAHAAAINPMQNRCVYLGNLHPDTTSEDLCNSIRGGILQHIRHIKDKRIAFATFIDPNSAALFLQLAQAMPQGLVVKNRRLRVSWGKSSVPVPQQVLMAVSSGASRNMYLGMLSPEVSEEQLRSDFEIFGEIELVNLLRDKRCGFVNFTDISSAIQAVEAMRSSDQEVKLPNGAVFKKPQGYADVRVNYGKDRCGNQPRIPKPASGEEQVGGGGPMPVMNGTGGGGPHAHHPHHLHQQLPHHNGAVMPGGAGGYGGPMDYPMGAAAVDASNPAMMMMMSAPFSMDPAMAHGGYHHQQQHLQGHIDPQKQHQHRPLLMTPNAGGNDQAAAAMGYGMMDMHQQQGNVMPGGGVGPTGNNGYYDPTSSSAMAAVAADSSGMMMHGGVQYAAPNMGSNPYYNSAVANGANGPGPAAGHYGQGKIPGIPVGFSWLRRKYISKAKVHRPTQAGIAVAKGNYGSPSIVISGNYMENKDFGDSFVYWKQVGSEGFEIWHYEFIRDDDEPAPWSPEGQRRIHELGLTMYYEQENPLDVEARNRMLTDYKKSITPVTFKSGQKKYGNYSNTGSSTKNSSSTTSVISKLRNKSLSPTSPKYTPGVRWLVGWKNEELAELMRLDRQNARLWTQIQEKYLNKEKYQLYPTIKKYFKCKMCSQRVVQRPVTLTCQHTFCESCLSDFIDKMPPEHHKQHLNCVVCKTSFAKQPARRFNPQTGRTEFFINLPLVNILRTVYPDYGAGDKRLEMPEKTPLPQMAKRTGKFSVGSSGKDGESGGVSPDSSITAPNNTNGGVIESSATNYFVKFQTKSEYYQNTKSDVDLLMYNLKFAKLDKYVTVGFVYDPNVLNACTIKIDTSSATAAQGTKKNVASIVRYIRQLNFVTSVDPVTSATTNSNNNGGGGSNIGFGEVTANKLPSKENSNPDGTNVFGNAV
ncbi:hypothetical protein H4219_002498 [Mycoemilia scoparia]|uniref:Uncharacterized protein n=1 Tax=Mycoemilia scoparia TaxID=417184 RepID=A0A9W8DQH9_9FUNG|nr:hypothetical protein H4219_002498 [Mycoemilia scoparia]